MRKVIAIDPGSEESGYVIVEKDTYRVLDKGKKTNGEVLDILMWTLLEASESLEDMPEVAIEMVASYGMPVGREVFETCVWIGRFIEACRGYYPRLERIYRAEEKLAICKSPKANDATIRRALADRFAYGEPNYGKGTKKKPGWFYGFSADIWQAYAVAVTYIDRTKGENKHEGNESCEGH